jgi:hypothetical protein
MRTKASVGASTRKARRLTRLDRALLAGIVAAAATLSLLPVAQAGPPSPTVPDEIQVLDGNKVFLGMR